MKLKYELLTAYMVDEGVISSREKQALRDIVEAAEGGLDPSVVASTEKLAHRAKLGCVRLKASTSGHQLVKTSIQADIMRNEAWMRKSVIRCLFGYMDDVTRMRERIPNYGETREFRDECGRNAENFDYPINLMFSGSMPIFENSSFEAVVKQMAEALK